MYNSGVDEHPELDLEELMNRMFDNYPSEFREYWALDGRDAPEHAEHGTWARHVELDRLARRIAELAAALVRPGKLRESDLQAPLQMRQAADEARTTLNALVQSIRAQYPDDRELESSLLGLRTLEEREYRFFRACLQLYLVEYLRWPGTLADRVVQLTRYAARVRKQRAVQYLSRVSRCYLYDMVPELGVMARAVVESLLEDEIPEEQVRKIRGVPKHRRVGLSDYIEVATGTVLSQDAARAARRLKQYGDDAVHVSADMIKDGETILEDLVVVLGALQAD